MPLAKVSCMGKLDIDDIGCTTFAQERLQKAMKYFTLPQSITFPQVNYKFNLKLLTHILFPSPRVIPKVTFSLGQIYYSFKLCLQTCPSFL